MADRAPTSFTEYLDPKTLRSGDPLVATTPDELVSDLVYLDQCEMLEVADGFGETMTFSTGSFVDMDGRFVWRAKQPIKASGSHYVAFRCWAEGTVTAFQIRLVVGAVTATLTVNSSITSKIWRAPSAFTLASGGSAYTGVVGGKRTGGTGNVNLAGVGIFAVAGA